MRLAASIPASLLLLACGRDTPPGAAPTLAPNELDLLLVVDNGTSMISEQRRLVDALPGLVSALAEGKLGDETFESFTDIHVGVISTDMGTGGVTVPGCASPDFGDDGLLSLEGNDAVEGCMADGYPGVLAFMSASTTPSPVEVAGFAADVACVSDLGGDGCGFPSTLEATLKALSPVSRADFHDGTGGHADGENAGFLRDDAMLLVIVVSNEDDCSARDPQLYDPGSETYAGTPLNRRCGVLTDALQPISRYVEGLVSLKDPRALVFATVAGIPADLAGADTVTVLADERMDAIADPADDTRPRPSCNLPGVGEAEPPRRLVSTAAGLGERGAHTELQSLCQEDYSVALDAIAARVIAARASLGE